MAKKQTEEVLDTEQAPVEEPKKVKTAKTDKAKTGFEEWQCEIKDGQPEKLRLKRAGVQISEEEAETLNVGRREGGNVGNVLLYFKPE